LLKPSQKLNLNISRKRPKHLKNGTRRKKDNRISPINTQSIKQTGRRSSLKEYNVYKQDLTEETNQA